MKLDNQQVLCHSTIGYRSDSNPYSFLADTKPFENKEKPLDSAGLSVEGIVKEHQNGVMHDIKGNGDSDPLVYLENSRDEWSASKLDYTMSISDFAGGNEKAVRDFVMSNSHSSKNMDSFQDSVIYLDRSVMECELPELVVCYKESTYHVVKDICIDEGVPTQDKFLFDSGMDERRDCNFLPSEKDHDNKLLKEKLESDMSMRDDSMPLEENLSGEDVDNECGSNKKPDANAHVQDVSLSLEENISLSVEENESNKGISNHSDSKNLILTREMKDDAIKMIKDDVSKELFTLGELLSMPELSTVNSEAISSGCKSDGIKLQSPQNPSEKEVMVTPSLVSAVEESNSSDEEAILPAPSLVSAAEESNSGKGEATQISPAQASASEESTGSSLVNEASYDGKLETGSITFDFDSSVPTSSRDECCHSLNHESLENGSTSKLENTVDQPADSFRRGNGESSFSGSGSVTGLISYSGPIAYSGNVSLRSDSSTTSTRSFAFPILQPEWNSSPVRMVKAGRRNYRKHKGWRKGLLCCRF